MTGSWDSPLFGRVREAEPDRPSVFVPAGGIEAVEGTFEEATVFGAWQASDSPRERR